MPKNHTDKEHFAAALSCIQTGILTFFPRKRQRSSPSPFISHRVLEAVAFRILKSLLCPLDANALDVFEERMSTVQRQDPWDITPYLQAVETMSLLKT